MSMAFHGDEDDKRIWQENLDADRVRKALARIERENKQRREDEFRDRPMTLHDD